MCAVDSLPSMTSRTSLTAFNKTGWALSCCIPSHNKYLIFSQQLVWSWRCGGASEEPQRRPRPSHRTVEERGASLKSGPAQLRSRGPLWRRHSCISKHWWNVLTLSVRPSFLSDSKHESGSKQSGAGTESVQPVVWRSWPIAVSEMLLLSREFPQVETARRISSRPHILILSSVWTTHTSATSTTNTNTRPLAAAMLDVCRLLRWSQAEDV